MLTSLKLIFEIIGMGATALFVLWLFKHPIEVFLHLKFGKHDCIGYPWGFYRIGCFHCKRRGFWKTITRQY